MTSHSLPFELDHPEEHLHSSWAGDGGIATLPEDPDRALDLIYADYLAQIDAYESKVRQQFYSRYPKFRRDLERQFLLHDYLQETAPDAEEAFPPHLKLGNIEGQIIGSYRVIEELRRGGSAIVYRAQHVGDGTLVALKVSRKGGPNPDARQKHVRTEGEILARLNHPSIIRLIEMGSTGGEVFLALELMEGGTLATRLAKQMIPASDAAALTRTLADAVQYMHDAGILHLDLNPRNVLLAVDNHPKVADLGSSRPWLVDASHGEVVETLGTPAYLAPEQIDGDPTQIGPWTDIFGLGGILYHALTGRPPFLSHSLTETLELVRTIDPVRPCELVPTVPRGLSRICLRCLAKKPADRYQTAREVSLALLGEQGTGELDRER